MNKRAAAGIALAALWCGQSLAQSATPLIDTELSKDTENPVTPHITLPLRYQADFNDGAYKATKDTFEIDQAVVPFRLNEDWALITRTKLPAVAQPPKNPGGSWASGLSNGYTTFFLSPEHGEGLYWGVGPVLYYPSGRNSALGVNKWGSGPSTAFVKKDESPWVLGAVVNNIWSIGSPPGDSDRTNQLPFCGWLVDWLIAEYHRELDRQRREMDGSGRRRFRQGGPARRAADKARPRRLLRCHSAQGRQRDLAAAGNIDLSVSGLGRLVLRLA